MRLLVLLIFILGIFAETGVVQAGTFDNFQCKTLKLNCTSEIERLLKESDFASAERSVKALGEEHIIDRDEYLTLLNFIKLGLLQKMHSFELEFSDYKNSRSNYQFEQARSSMEHIDKYLNHSGNVVERSFKYFSRDFSEFIKNKIDDIYTKQAEMIAMYNTDLTNQAAEARKEREIFQKEQENFQEERKKALKEEEDAQRIKLAAERKKIEDAEIAERLRLEKEAEAKRQFDSALHDAKETAQYKKFWYEANICCAIRDKQYYESEIKKDANYATKYRLNISRSSDSIDHIKSDDILIEQWSKEYGLVFKRKFSTNSCKKIDCDNYQQQLDELAQKIVDKKIADELSRQ